MKPEQLVNYLSARMPDVGPISVENVSRIPGGASRETWSFDAIWKERGTDVRHGFIIRRDPPASLLETERDLEFRLYQALQDTGVPVPKVYWLETDPRWLDRTFFMMSRIDGQTDPRTLCTDPTYEPIRGEVARQKAEILARIHNIDWEAKGLHFLGVPASPAACADMEIERWESTMRKDQLEPQPVLEMAISWLKRNKPAPAQRISIVHADYRTGNFLYTAQEGIKGVLDWEMAHLGDPLEDVAWACIKSWRWSGDGKIGGLLDREDFYRLYEQYSGLKVDRQAVHFWEVLGNLKLAVIFITGAQSYCTGKTNEIMLALTSYINPSIELEILNLIGG